MWPGSDRTRRRAPSGSFMAGSAPIFGHTYTDETQPSSPSVLNPGFDPSNWFAAEPIGVAVLALLAAAGLVVWWRSAIRAIAAAMLLAYGVQACLLFAGYVELEVKSPAAQLAPGVVIGMMAVSCFSREGWSECSRCFGANPDRRRNCRINDQPGGGRSRSALEALSTVLWAERYVQ